MKRHSTQQNVSTFLGRVFQQKSTVTSSNNNTAGKNNKTEKSLFQNQKGKNLEVEREKKTTVTKVRGGENKHLCPIFSLSVSSLLFRTQWLLFPPPRYACNAILFFSRSSAVRVGGSLPGFRPTRYFSPLIIENGCVPKKKKFSLAQREGE